MLIICCTMARTNLVSAAWVAGAAGRLSPSVLPSYEEQAHQRTGFYIWHISGKEPAYYC